jgi:hypothetical protein
MSQEQRTKYLTVSKLERRILELFERASVCLFIEGRRGSGKSWTALYLAEVLHKYAEITRVRKYGTNIAINGGPFPIDFINNLEDLTAWAKESRERKFFILDEVGTAIQKRTPMAGINIGMIRNLQVLRHWSLSMVYIAPSEKYVDSSMLGSDILDVIFLKPDFENPKLGVWVDVLRETNERFYGIPATSFKFDTHGSAEFLKDALHKGPRFKDSDLNLLWDWSHDLLKDIDGKTRVRLFKLRKDFIRKGLEEGKLVVAKE